MSSSILVALLSVSFLSAGGQTYDQALAQANADSSRPLVVLVGADWCPACQHMKQAVIPELQQKGVMDKVAFATVNTDRDSKLAGQLMEGNSIPQLVMFVKTDTGWHRSQLTGSQSSSAVEGFLAEGQKAGAARLASAKTIAKPTAN